MMPKSNPPSHSVHSAIAAACQSGLSLHDADPPFATRPPLLPTIFPSLVTQIFHLFESHRAKAF